MGVFAVYLLAQALSAAPAPQPSATTDAPVASWSEAHDRAGALMAAGRPAEAEPIYRALLAKVQAEQGEHHLLAGTSWLDLAAALAALDRHAEAAAAYRQALEIVRAGLGGEQVPVAMIEDRLATSLDAEGRYAEAEPLHRHSADLLARLAGAADPMAAASLENLAVNLDRQARYREAEGIPRKLIAVLGPALGETDAQTLAIRANLAANLDAQGRYAEAEPIHRAVLEQRRALLGETKAATAASYDNLGVNLDHQDRFGEAEPYHRKALNIRRQLLGEDRPETATSIANLAASLDGQGRFAEAERLYRKALAIRRATLGEAHPDTASAYDALAADLDSRGGCQAAEPLYRRALAIREAALGGSHPDTATSLNNLAFCLAAEGRPELAEPLFRRVAAVKRAALGEGHADNATALDNLAASLDAQDRQGEAEPLHRQALAIRRQLFGEDHPETARGLNNLAFSLGRQGRLTEAEPMLRRSLDILRRRLGEAHPTTGMAYGALGSNLVAQGRRAQARPLLRRSVEILERALGPSHPELIRSLVDLSVALQDDRQGRREALDLAARAAAIAGNAAAPPGPATAAEASLAAARDPDKRRRNPSAHAFDALLRAAWMRAADAPGEAAALRDRAFLAAQAVHVSAAAEALAQIAARTAAGDGEIGALARRQQDLAARLRTLDSRLVQAYGSGATTTALRSELDSRAAELAAIEAGLRAGFPAYADLVMPKPLSIGEVQKRLRKGEALLLLVPSGEDIFTFAVSPERAEWLRLPGGARQVVGAVRALRCQLDEQACAGAEAATRPGFSLETAHRLYRDLVLPSEPVIAGASRLYVAASGPLSDLPPALLPTRLPGAAEPDPLRRFAGTAWLSDRYALISLPAVSSLGILRQSGAGQPADFVGFGDPALGGEQRGQKQARLAGLLFTGVDENGVALANPASLRRMEGLPGTAVELEAMAKILGAAPGSIHLGAEATESAVKSSPAVARARVLAFSTHGVLPHDLGGIAEPGLVLTPPDVPSARDDGVLTASEVSQLSLAADWVILSACNTATSDGTPGADSLSSLARAFLYAGSRALLASHWRVGDEVTSTLVVETLAAARARPEAGRAAALQSAMRSVRTGRRADGSPVPGWRAEWADPAAWAPFTLIATEDISALPPRGE